MRRGFDSCVSKKSLQYSCLKNPMDRGVWLTTGQRVEKNRTQLSVHYTWPFYHKKVKQYQSCFTDACSVYSEEATAPNSSTLAWKIPWMEEPGRLQSMGSLRVRHDWATSLSLSSIGEGNGNPLQCSCLENPRDRGAWWAAIYGVTQSRIQLTRLSSSSFVYYKVGASFPIFKWKIAQSD